MLHTYQLIGAVCCGVDCLTTVSQSVTSISCTAVFLLMLPLYTLMMIVVMWFSVLEGIEQLAKQLEPEMMKKATQSEFLQKKARDYRSTMKQLMVNSQPCAVCVCAVCV